eukprot:m51a1_g1954 putative proteasome subunit beta type 1 (231) ;mRNA; f:1020634-1021800
MAAVAEIVKAHTQHKSQFDPYVDNAGTTLALAGKDFVVVAADTRMSLGYAIPTRSHHKIFKLTNKCVLSASGMQADMRALVKRLEMELERFQHQHGKQMSAPALAQFLSNTLYYKRFFPFYAFCILAGLDDANRPWVWTYDAVGSFQATTQTAQGSASGLVQPLLDCHIARANRVEAQPHVLATAEEACAIAREAMTSAAERDIHTGDWMDICVVDANGVRTDQVLLKHD